MAQAKLHCSYQHSLNTKVHIFSFDVPDKQSVEEFIVHLGKAIETLQEQETLTMIVDLRPAGIPPFNYAIQSVRRYFSHRHPPKIRVAYLYDKNLFLTIIRTFVALIPLESERKFFQGSLQSDVQQEATSWLLEKQQEPV